MVVAGSPHIGRIMVLRNMSLDSEDLSKFSAVASSFAPGTHRRDDISEVRSPEKAPHHWRPSSAAIRVRTFVYPLVLDALCISISFAIAATARGVFLKETTWVFVLALILPAYLLVALNSKVYSIRLLSERWPAIGRTLRAYLIALALMTLAGFYLKTSYIFPRLTVALASGIAAALLTVTRYCFVRFRRTFVGGEPYSTALIWEPGQATPPINFSVRIAAEGFADPERHDPIMYDRLATALSGIHNVVVSCHPDRRVAWTKALKGAGIQSEILMPELQSLAPLGMSIHGSMAAVVVSHGPLNLADRLIKRVFDFGVALFAIVVLSPVLLLVALLIKLESRGPVFFRQDRIGRSNQVFRIVKFRSMTVEGSDGHGGRSASRDDNRVTRVGRFIRGTSIDELPQLFNVLSGTMSIVGPRPHALGSRAADKLFWEVDERYWHRHATKPGLTGLAQVRGYRGATLLEDDLRNRLQADLEYLEAWSIWRDLKIIVMTFRVLVHKNAF
jgi:lipopolysaccharide/colanic/teichoic acid biosynthesis glycosyltransferase